MARKYTLPGLISFLLTGCTGVPDGVTPVTGFDAERYLGTWYEIARLDHRFERGLTDVTATYTARDDGGIDVVNRGYDADAGEWKAATGRAYFIDSRDTGRLKVSFFGPFYGAYNIAELGADYDYALVTGPNRSYLWILAREPQLDASVRERLVANAASLGFPVQELIRVTHARAGATN